jgi:isoamylase
MPTPLPKSQDFALGVRYKARSKTLTFRVYSKNATRLEICFFIQPQAADEVERLPMTRESGDTWVLEIPWPKLQAKGLDASVYYGFRAWGPNWVHEQTWKKGTEIGFFSDVDDQGNRFNPNKLLLDPYGREISHDPYPRLSEIDPNEYRDNYYSGPGFRQIDTARIAPKSVFVIKKERTAFGSKPKRSLKDDIIYEAHVRGLTMLDVSIPEDCRGTYKGAGMKAKFLQDLGVTAVEFLPVHHFASEQNDDGDPRGDNHWGYMTLGYFAPNRRYSSDRTPGGPTREFKEMVRAFHSMGIKVFLDVVYNHTGEGLLKRATDFGDSRQDDSRQFADRACLLSFRGLDNASYYTLRSRQDLDNGTNRRYQDNSACGGSLNVANDMVRGFIMDSLQYWSDEMGVDGFRFDLAPVLGNARCEGGFEFNSTDPKNVLNRMVTELPVRDPQTLVGVDLIAEPWAVGDGTYQLGNFPDGWAEWNDVFRSTFRQAENKLHVVPIPPASIASGFAGSDQQFLNKGARRDPRPYHSINYISSHDGYTLRDVFSYTNMQDVWDHGGNDASQRQAVRNAFAILMVAAGTPIFCFGDELFRTLNGRDNVVAVDDASVYLDWVHFNQYALAIQTNDQALLGEMRRHEDIRIYEFARNLIRFRQLYPSLRPARYFTGSDMNQAELKDIAWFRWDGSELAGSDWGDPNIHFLAFRVANQAFLSTTGVASIYVAYNRSDHDDSIVLPENLAGRRWFRMVDTAGWMEALGNFENGTTMLERSYIMHERSVLILIEK